MSKNINDEQTKNLELLTQAGALITNSHFVYTSGKHGSTYINKDAIYPHTQLTSSLCKKIAQYFSSKKIEVVLAPAMGGIILSQWVAFHLSELSGVTVYGVYAEKNLEHSHVERATRELGDASVSNVLDSGATHTLGVGKRVSGANMNATKYNGDFILKRGYDLLVQNKRVLIVEDVLNTGGSVKKLVKLARLHKGEVVGVGALCNRGDVTPEDLQPENACLERKRVERPPEALARGGDASGSNALGVGATHTLGVGKRVNGSNLDTTKSDVQATNWPEHSQDGNATKWNANPTQYPEDLKDANPTQYKDNSRNILELFSVFNIKLEAWDKALCPLCAQGVPIHAKLGKGLSKTSSRG